MELEKITDKNELISDSDSSKQPTLEKLITTEEKQGQEMLYKDNQDNPSSEDETKKLTEEDDDDIPMPMNLLTLILALFLIFFNMETDTTIIFKFKRYLAKSFLFLNMIYLVAFFFCFILFE